MHKEVLNENQLQLLPLMSEFKREFFLVGGTAIALHIGHRRSIDFDLFKEKKLNIKKILEKLDGRSNEYIITRRVSEQLNLVINNVKLTFFQFPYTIISDIAFEKIFKMPDLLSLAAMKAFALGRRAKWKDYVDLYFILKDHFSLIQIAQKANSLFKDQFSEKLFRAQISFFDDIDYSEKVEFLKTSIDEHEIKAFLIDNATSF
jgi:hypothetical protein